MLYKEKGKTQVSATIGGGWAGELTECELCGEAGEECFPDTTILRKIPLPNRAHW
jgi:hypothetical protein